MNFRTLLIVFEIFLLQHLSVDGAVPCDKLDNEICRFESTVATVIPSIDNKINKYFYSDQSQSCRGIICVGWIF